MIAALPMYDSAECQPANDRLWALIRDGLRAGGMDAPDALHHGDAELLPQWQRPDLILSQTCGFPYRAVLHGHVQIVATPDYALPGCAPGYYRSVFVARADDPRHNVAQFDGTPIAYNDALSQSGWAAPQNHAKILGISLPAGPCTGAHGASMLAVAQGLADIAALDAVTWSLLQEYAPETRALRVVGQTAPTPGLPLITARGNDAAALRAAVAQAIPRLSATDRRTLRLHGLALIAPESYLAVPTPQPPAPFAPLN